jgi:hypothetical protein
VILDTHKISFRNIPSVTFLFSNLSGRAVAKSAWELIHLKTKIGIRENSNFTANKINLWGWKQVVSPETFYDIDLAPGASAEWTRSYEVFEV